MYKALAFNKKKSSPARGGEVGSALSVDPGVHAVGEVRPGIEAEHSSSATRDDHRSSVNTVLDAEFVKWRASHVLEVVSDRREGAVLDVAAATVSGGETHVLLDRQPIARGHVRGHACEKVDEIFALQDEAVEILANHETPTIDQLEVACVKRHR